MSAPRHSRTEEWWADPATAPDTQEIPVVPPTVESAVARPAIPAQPMPSYSMPAQPMPSQSTPSPFMPSQSMPSQSMPAPSWRPRHADVLSTGLERLAPPEPPEPPAEKRGRRPLIGLLVTAALTVSGLAVVIGRPPQAPEAETVFIAPSVVEESAAEQPASPPGVAPSDAVAVTPAQPSPAGARATDAAPAVAARRTPVASRSTQAVTPSDPPATSATPSPTPSPTPTPTPSPTPSPTPTPTPTPSPTPTPASPPDPGTVSVEAGAFSMRVSWDAVSDIDGRDVECTVVLSSRTRQVASDSVGTRKGSFTVLVSRGTSYQATKTCTYSGGRDDEPDGTVTSTSDWVDA